ncbi:hypothetical protein [Okibacterium endophyticum]
MLTSHPMNDMCPGCGPYRVSAAAIVRHRLQAGRRNPLRAGTGQVEAQE